MRKPNKILVKKIIKELKTKSRNIKSIERFVKLAFDFRVDNVSIEPMQSKEEIYSLLKIVSRHKPKVIMEIGTARGGTLFLLSKIAEPNATLISIDLPNGEFGGEFYPEWKQPIYQSFPPKKQKMHLLRSNSHSSKCFEKVRSILRNRKIDFLFIDGDHSYNGIKKDFQMYKKLVSNNGLIALHDINEENSLNVKVSKFWNQIKSRHENFEIVSNQKGKGFGIGFVVPLGLAKSKKYTEILKELLSLKNVKISKLRNNPLSLLLFLYSERNDLQKAFPEVKKGIFTNLILWAALNLTHKNKIEKEVNDNLSNFTSWFNEFQNMHEKEQLSMKLEKSLKGKQNENQNLSDFIKTKDEDLRNSIKYSNELNDILEDKDRTLVELENLVKSKEGQIKELEKIKNEKDDDFAVLQKLAAEREKYAKELEVAIKEKDAHFDNLEKIAYEREKYAITLEGITKEKTQAVRELEKVIKEKEHTVFALEKLAKSNESRIAEIEKLAYEREKYAITLEGITKEKTQAAAELEKLAYEREKYAKDLERVMQEKDFHYTTLEELSKSNSIHVEELSNILKRKEEDIDELNNVIKEKEYQLIELRSQLTQIEKSITFNIMRKLGKTIDSTFPNKTKRGEVKKVVSSSMSMISQDGFPEYLSAVKDKIRKREFRILEPMNLSESEEQSLREVVTKNRKKRLKIKPHDKRQIKNDEFIIPEKEDLI